MVKLNLDLPQYSQLKKDLPDICPNVRFYLESSDETLVKLGLREVASCVVAFELDKKEFKNLLDELTQIEVDAFNTPNGEYPKSDNMDFQRYLKYGWINDVLSDAYKKTIICI